MHTTTTAGHCANTTQVGPPPGRAPQGAQSRGRTAVRPAAPPAPRSLARHQTGRGSARHDVTAITQPVPAVPHAYATGPGPPEPRGDTGNRSLSGNGVTRGNASAAATGRTEPGQRGGKEAPERTSAHGDAPRVLPANLENFTALRDSAPGASLPVPPRRDRTPPLPLRPRLTCPQRLSGGAQRLSEAALRQQLLQPPAGPRPLALSREPLLGQLAEHHAGAQRGGGRAGAPRRQQPVPAAAAAGPQLSPQTAAAVGVPARDGHRLAQKAPAAAAPQRSLGSAFGAALPAAARPLPQAVVEHQALHQGPEAPRAGERPEAQRRQGGARRFLQAAPPLPVRFLSEPPAASRLRRRVRAHGHGRERHRLPARPRGVWRCRSGRRARRCARR